MHPETNNPAALALSALPQAASETDRNGSRQDSQEQVADREELTYDFVPPKKGVTVSVCYRIGGRGRPLPYPLDEGDGQ